MMRKAVCEGLTLQKLYKHTSHLVSAGSGWGTIVLLDAHCHLAPHHSPPASHSCWLQMSLGT
jgi:hypothetical protein